MAHELCWQWFLMPSWNTNVSLVRGVIVSEKKVLLPMPSSKVQLTFQEVNEPPHDKTSKMTVRPAKNQIRLGGCPKSDQSSLCAQWVAKDPSFLHADAQADLSLRWAHMPFRWFCHSGGSNVRNHLLQYWSREDSKCLHEYEKWIEKARLRNWKHDCGIYIFIFKLAVSVKMARPVC